MGTVAISAKIAIYISDKLAFKILGVFLNDHYLLNEEHSKGKAKAVMLLIAIELHMDAHHILHHKR